MKLAPDDLQLLDAWIAAQGEMSRPEGLRRIVKLVAMRMPAKPRRKPSSAQRIAFARWVNERRFASIRPIMLRFVNFSLWAAYPIRRYGVDETGGQGTCVS